MVSASAGQLLRPIACGRIETIARFIIEAACDEAALSARLLNFHHCQSFPQGA
jgi:hypothetical protein